MSNPMFSSLHAFQRSKHDVRASQTMIEPSSGENGFGSLTVGSSIHNLTVITDDPALLRDLAVKAVRLANRVEAMNRLHETAKAIDARPEPADDDVLAALAVSELM
jgi:hypothetical protein